MTETTTPNDERPLSRRDDEGSGRGRASRLDATSWIPALVVLVVLSLCAAGYGLTRSSKAGAATAPVGTITVTGTGTIEGTPNTVQFSVGIHTVRSNAVAALGANNSQIARLEGTFHAYHVAFKDMQTNNVNFYEQTNRYGTFTGFAVDDSLQVTVPNVRLAGKVIDAAVRIAGNGIQFNGVSFSISNESTLLASARERAMQSALAVARQLASGGGETVGSIQKVTDNEGQQTYFPYHTFAQASATAYVGVPLETGRQPVSVQVTVVYSLNP
ncbi:MAG TPA: SIMPL domain-containing protein [Acidimicrobiales bacterium]|jgi:hypothetical protein|nr:SIMPL domain-containing protein [Acidimicrobiales bacterium]